MVNTSTRQLFNQLNESERLIRSKNVNSEEKLALAGYIVNIYRGLLCMGKADIDFDRKKCFGGDRCYNKFIKGINYYSDKMIDNFLKNKKFHKNFFSEILPDIEDELSKIEDLEKDDVYFSRDDFCDIIFQFMKSINLSDLFDKMYKNGRIYSTIVGQDSHNLGSTLYNPLNGDTDIFIRDLQYSLNDMNTTVHELGHVYDFSKFDGNIYKYNNYFYSSFYGEVLSRLFERLFFKYMRDHNIKRNEVNNLHNEFQLLNHSFLLQAYILSLLSDKFITEDKYLECDSSEIVEIVGSHFIDEGYIKEFIEKVINFDLSEVYNYAYGDIISLFLYNEVNKCGFNNEMIDYFLKNRCDLFSEDYFRECGYGPGNYVKLYKKEMKKNRRIG